MVTDSETVNEIGLQLCEAREQNDHCRRHRTAPCVPCWRAAIRAIELGATLPSKLSKAEIACDIAYEARLTITPWGTLSDSGKAAWERIVAAIEKEGNQDKKPPRSDAQRGGEV